MPSPLAVHGSTHRTALARNHARTKPRPSRSPRMLVVAQRDEVVLKRTPLEPEHRKLGAKIGAFAGWAMPIQYRGTLAEHRAVREAVGLFDLTHLGKIDVAGPGAFEALQRAMPNDLSKVKVGAAQYNMVLNERGGIVDDLI